ncbi:hypothetical protein NJB1507_08380 [Mycobacterium marinum]|uniref:DUF732 domain-containing protein n=1 Tax=Mycobacterium marinum TaxID=1781 RepID=UPI00235B398B|nr:hypothetical protein NJB1507_08380 [Mycobacterium marinum]
MADDSATDDTAAAAAPEDATAVVPDVARTEAAELAWSDEAGVDAESAAVTDGRRPLSRSLKLLLGSVGIGAVALAAFVIGHRQVATREAALETPRAATTTFQAAPPSQATSPTTPPTSVALPALPAPSSTAPTGPVARFLNRVHAAAMPLTDAKALTLGRASCADLGNGIAVSAILASNNPGFGDAPVLTAAQNWELFSAAVSELCPQFRTGY